MAKANSAEFGDFQTPPGLAAEVCRLLVRCGVKPAAVVEPTCGVGNFLSAAMDAFPDAPCLGAEINPEYVDQANTMLARRDDGHRARIVCNSFFDIDWQAVMGGMAEPLLVLGNPPWVTNSQLGSLGSDNLPAKTNFKNALGLDALTGKSNFDISEWMLIRLLERLEGRSAWLAVLCKTAVARKVLAQAWLKGRGFAWAEIRGIDAKAAFNASVDACLLVCATSPDGLSRECAVYPSLDANEPSAILGVRDDQFLADIPAFERWKHLSGDGPHQWRSGVKHDCSKVMELVCDGDAFLNGYGERVELEPDYLYPMLKSSEVANGRTGRPKRWMLVPQRSVGQDTAVIAKRAPKTWDYLRNHGDALDRRGSSIYRNRPRFSVFGVGTYTFSPWKVAISGFYKRLAFTAVAGYQGKPIVFDDTVYFLPCGNEEEARGLESLLNSETARAFFSAFVFWDSKRPITVELLRRLDLRRLAKSCGIELPTAAIAERSLLDFA
jgi:hypothetical protein